MLKKYEGDINKFIRIYGNGNSNIDTEDLRSELIFILFKCYTKHYHRISIFKTSIKYQALRKAFRYTIYMELTSEI